ncbi:capsular polysaccharide biosynthesis protein [Alkalilimnicola ehrlichii]|uniref:capsular polysaccharide biosynthesis protein n=1 Tax=Alkalilimnicola ehrlichii TaxID=351052 RepID=UPI002162B450|nr:capsular polysaccharide biosynthesis protein [Alkalilimnicola ehrlichii]
MAWGRKPSARRAVEFARRKGLAVTHLEDGFLRSVDLGDRDAALSLVTDELGIYYDATCPSRLERLIRAPIGAAQAARARALLRQWREARVSKYNHAREASAGLPSSFVLLADQTVGDVSVRYGCAGPASFQRMLEAALDENPGAPILLKVHPDVFAGRKRGYFDKLTTAQAARVRVLGQDVHPVALLERAERVYVVTSQLGFEGLLWDKPVRTFGMPFYAGWGLTQDELAAPERRGAATVEQLAHSALVAYPRYLDPETGRRCEVERAVEWMGLQRTLRERFPEQVYALGFSLWKRPIVRAFFQGSQVRFVRREQQLPKRATVAVWGQRPVARGRPVIRLEDGFLRSVGLGAELTRPLSWVLDEQGLYYDAGTPSGLEQLLQSARFEPALLARARRLRERIVELGLTKYNVGQGEWRRPAGVNTVVLAVGQVEGDAAMRFGAGAVTSNLGLLRAVRQAVPHAYLVYKPHPDVLAGLRAVGSGEADCVYWCDEVVADVPMGALLESVDEVHVMTSLAGFEALLRGRQVVTHGRPFYAGWGLTQDRAPIARRSRQLNLDQLVAASLILYPTYVSRASGRFSTPECVLRELEAWRQTAPDASLWRYLFRWLYRCQRGLERWQSGDKQVKKTANLE